MREPFSGTLFPSAAETERALSTVSPKKDPKKEVSPKNEQPWRGELRAMLALAWPLILANLTQQVIQATDVLLMGRLGSTQLAAATLALNLTFTFNIFLLGLIT